VKSRCAAVFIVLGVVVALGIAGLWAVVRQRAPDLRVADHSTAGRQRQATFRITNTGRHPMLLSGETQVRAQTSRGDENVLRYSLHATGVVNHDELLPGREAEFVIAYVLPENTAPSAGFQFGVQIYEPPGPWNRFLARFLPASMRPSTSAGQYHYIWSEVVTP
jgi:hypothetical protein